MFNSPVATKYKPREILVWECCNRAKCLEVNGLGRAFFAYCLLYPELVPLGEKLQGLLSV